MSEKNESKETRPVPRSFFSEWDPFRDLFRSPMRLARHMPEMWGEEGSLGGWSPAMDIVESDDGYAITMELAGARKDDVQVECHECVLTIKGEKQSEREEKDEHRHYKERSFGSFTRSVRLPVDASDDVKATFRDGVLTVSIPKIEERKARSVSIDT